LGVFELQVFICLPAPVLHVGLQLLEVLAGRGLVLGEKLSVALLLQQ